MAFAAGWDGFCRKNTARWLELHKCEAQEITVWDEWNTLDEKNVPAQTVDLKDDRTRKVKTSRKKAVA